VIGVKKKVDQAGNTGILSGIYPDTREKTLRVSSLLPRKGVGSWESHIPTNTPFDKLCGSWDRIEPVKGANEVDAPFLTSVMITMENIQRRKEGLQ